jgi:TolA-binding protein
MGQADRFDVIFFGTLVLFVWALVTDMRVPAAADDQDKSVRDQIQQLKERIERLEQERQYAEIGQRRFITNRMGTFLELARV